MNNVSKVLLSCGFVFSTAIGAAAIYSHQPHAQAAETPHYNFTGYTSANSEFILDEDFINAIKHDNLTMNGYSITKGTTDTVQLVDIYDQQFCERGENNADFVLFELDGKTVSQNDLLEVYAPSDVYETPDGNMYERDYNGTLIQFYENDGYITKVKIQAYE